MTKFTVLLPIHNEASWLPYSLPSVFALNPNEILLLLDRCSDNSVEVAKELAFKHQMSDKLKLIEVNDASDYRLRFAYLRTFGCSLCTHDIVLVTAADLIIDSQIAQFVDLIGKYGLITFEHKDYPVNWRMVVKRLLSGFLPFDWLGGVRLFDRRLMFRFEDLEELKSLDSEDTHLADAIRKHARTLYVISNTIHLRPKESIKRHYLRGRLYWSVAHRSFLITLLSALSMFRLNLIKGYIYERFGK